MTADRVGNGASRDTVQVLGLPVDTKTFDESIEAIQGFIASGRPHIVVTADAAGLVNSVDDTEHREVIREADLVTADSVGVLWAVRRATGRKLERVSGVDIAEKLVALSADTGYRIYFLGGAPGVADLAAERMRLKYPGCNIVGSRHGYFPAESDSVVALEVAGAKPDVLLVAMGIPRQEKFIKRTQKTIQACVAIGVGGTLDVMSGTAKRAPRIFQKLKLEWLWRTIANPKKLKKAAMLPKFLMLVLRDKS